MNPLDPQVPTHHMQLIRSRLRNIPWLRARGWERLSVLRLASTF